LFVAKHIIFPKTASTFRLLFLLCISFLLPLRSWSQTQAWTIEVRGTVEENDKKLPGAVVSVYQDNNLVNSMTTPSGNFGFTLQGDNNYTIAFTKPGYITKRISFSTKNVPADRAKYGFSAYSDIEVNIFPEIPGTDVDQILMQPIGKIGYDPSFHNGDFTYDSKYTASIQSLLEKILEAQRAAAEKARQLEAQYKKAIAKADGEFNAKDYTNARNDYNVAQSIKPDEQYPKDQLAAIEKAIAASAAANAAAAQKAAAQKALQAKYDSLIKIGDADFKTQTYPAAKSAYNAALQVKPSEQYPKDQLALIDKAMAGAAQKAALQAKYDSLIKVGDNAFKTKSYANAKSAYNGALQVKSGEQYPKDQLAAIDKAMAADADASKKAALQAKYDSLVKIGDNAFKTKTYSNAKSAYNGALQVKPNEQYPKDQLAAIDKAIAADADASKKAAVQAKYDSLVKIGDNAFKTKSYSNAKSAYNGALQVKPNEQYPKDQLAAIDKAIAADADAAKNAAIQAKYDSLVKIGDNAFKTKSFDNARMAYKGALLVKSGEQYPKDQLAAIDKAIADAADVAKTAALQAKYDSLVKIGDNAFKGKTYGTAKSAYTSALQVKPSEQYPKDQLAAIDKAIAADADANKKAALQAKYDSLIKVGDGAFNAKIYADAKTAYNGALQIKSTETYPKDQLALIDKALADAAANAKKAGMQAKYDSLVKIGDDAFKTKSYDNARTAYKGALQVKATEQYPKDQLAAIDKAIAADADASKKAALQAKYDSLVKIGDDAFKTKNFDNAKAAYSGALKVKPGEQYPKDQLAAIIKAIADEADAAKKAAMQAKYDSLVKIGDAAFKEKGYDNAKSAYTSALSIKPSEQYPKDQLAAIDKALSAQMDAAKKAAMQAKYDSLVKAGDNAFKTKDYSNAKSDYNAALQVKSSEQYPKDQLALIDKALADEAFASKKASMQKAMQAKYDSLIQIGDNAFKTKSYTNAKSAYNGALQVKSNEQYSKDQLALIDKALADQDAAQKAANQKATQAKYDSLVKIGDAAFKTKDYSNARSAYNGALQVKSAEQYPKDQLAAIDKALADQDASAKKDAQLKAVQAKYDSLVKVGDDAFGTKDYSPARAAYTAALQVKPNEQYPKTQLAAIDKALADDANAAKKAAMQKITQAKYDSIIKLADKAFNKKDFSGALPLYTNASQLKPTEQYPKDQIAAINKQNQQQAANDAAYNRLISTGNQNYYTKHYSEALTAYKQALDLRPGDSYAKKRILEIQNLMGQGGNTVQSPPKDTASNDAAADSVASKYAQGITEEHIDEPNCAITRRVVVKGKRGWIYTKKSWNFGTYYFKASPPDYEDVTITEGTWNQETISSK
jgi:hypothetical protein